MSDFNYEIETINHYYFENLTVNGKAVQDGTPTPSSPVPVEVVEPVDGVFGISVNGVVTPIDLQGNVLASLPDGTKDVLTVDNTGAVTLEKNVGVAVIDGVTVKCSWKTIYGNNVRANITLPGQLNVSSSKRLNCYNDKFRISEEPVNTPAQDSSAYSYELYTSFSFAVIPIAALASSDIADINAWFAANPTTVVYPLATPQTIELSTIDVSNLQDIPEETPILIVSTIDPVTSYSYRNTPTYQVLNSYENANAPEYAFPPYHMGQMWETFDANNWNETEMLDYTGQMESHSVYTVELCELMQSGAFDWSRPELDWSEAAYDQEQHERFCKYFEARFMFREIGMLPPLQWFTAFRRMMVYELMPKYKPLYAQVESGIAPLGENEYYKERHITSAYPETLLSGNSDYISSGEDKEWERVKVNNAAEALEAYRNGFRSVDAALADELEVLFISMYTSYVNGL